MATVPGDPSAPEQPTMPKWAEPTMADFLQAAAIMDQKGRFKVAGDTQAEGGTGRYGLPPKEYQKQMDYSKQLQGMWDQIQSQREDRKGYYSDEPTERQKFKRQQSEKPDIEDLRYKVIEDPKGAQSERLGKRKNGERA